MNALLFCYGRVGWASPYLSLSLYPFTHPPTHLPTGGSQHDTEERDRGFCWKRFSTKVPHPPTHPTHSSSFKPRSSPLTHPPTPFTVAHSNRLVLLHLINPPTHLYTYNSSIHPPHPPTHPPIQYLHNPSEDIIPQDYHSSSSSSSSSSTHPTPSIQQRIRTASF